MPLMHLVHRINCANKTSLLSLLILFVVFSVHAQQPIIGRITSIQGQPLAGVTVIKKGSTLATQTDTTGKYNIQATKGDILVFTFIGYETTEVRVGNESTINQEMTLRINSLNEVVVTGYLSQRIKDITGSVSVVKQKDLTEVPVGQVEQMLQGKVAGLNVINSGEPGAPSQIYLHGIGNFGNVTPLYIIDGVEGDINSINPYDIESIQVLKDAAAYSIYGVRGANGVILATTKKGNNSRTKLTYDFYVGKTYPLKHGLDRLNPQEQADLEWTAQWNSGQTPSDPLYGSSGSPVLPDYLFAGPFVGLQNGDPRTDPSLYNIDSTFGNIYQIVKFNKSGTDWFHELFKPVTSQNHTLTVSGGSDKNHYLLSFGYLDQQGTYLNTFLKRFTVRVNTDFLVLNSIRIGENIQLSYDENPRVGSTGQAFGTLPYLPLYDIIGNSSSMGSAATSGINLSSPAGNPVSARLLTKDDKTTNWQLFGNAYAEIDFLKHFNFRTSFGGPLNYYFGYNFVFGSYQPPPNGTPSSYFENSGYSNSWTWTNTLVYTNSFRENHHIRILLGAEDKNNYSRGMSASRSGYTRTDLSYRLLNTGSLTGLTNSDNVASSYLSSFFSQLLYDYKEKYFISGTLRRDASSVFGPDSRYGWFPAVGIAWRMTEESFLKASTWITELKLRASWGKTGYDDNTSPTNQFTVYGGGFGGSYYDIYGRSTGSIQQGYRPVGLGNSKTGWQQDAVTNFGLDAVFWNGKLSLAADWFNKSSQGLLYPASLPAILGEATPPNVNIGTIKNTGVDLTVGSRGYFSKNWSWNIFVTFSHYENRVIKLNDVPFFFDNNFPAIRNEVGYPISSFYGYKIIGFFRDEADIAKSPPQQDAKPGRFKYLDANKDGQINDLDQIHIGNPNPKFTLGLNVGINFKGFDFSTVFYGSFGNDVLNFYRAAMDVFESPIYAGPNSKTALYNSWTPEKAIHNNFKAPIEEASQNFSNSAVFNTYPLEKGSYFRNRSLILGFSLPKTLLQKIKVDRLRVYVQAVNLFTITKYTGLDPELSGVIDRGSQSGSSSAFGIDAPGNYPNNQKQWYIGINLGL